jgi:hypothetical protein
MARMVKTTPARKIMAAKFITSSEGQPGPLDDVVEVRLYCHLG